MNMLMANDHGTPCAARRNTNQEEKDMSFVNEYIPEADFEKYNFAELNRRTRKGMDTATSWTIDREADIWLRKFYSESDHTAPDGGFTGVSAWDFYWKGTLMMAEVKALASGGGGNSPRWARSRLCSINNPFELEIRRSEVLKDLEAAFTAYRGAGVLSSNDSLEYTFTLES